MEDGNRVGKKRLQRVGSLLVNLRDGKEINVAVHKAGPTVELRLDHPNSGCPVKVLVTLMNQDTVEGWMREIEAQCNLYIANWQWK